MDVKRFSKYAVQIKDFFWHNRSIVLTGHFASELSWSERNIFACFIIKKHLTRIQHPKIIEILKNTCWQQIYLLNRKSLLKTKGCYQSWQEDNKDDNYLMRNQIRLFFHQYFFYWGLQWITWFLTLACFWPSTL